MKKLLVGIGLLLLGGFHALSAQPCCCGQRGFYGGVQGGYGNQYFKTGSSGTNTFDGFTITSVHTQKSDDGVAGRVFLGYAGNCWLGVEGGAALFSDLKWNIITDFESGMQVKVKMVVSTYALDYLARVSYSPFKCLTIFGKGGIAYVHSDIKLKDSITMSKHAFRPEVAVGCRVPISKRIGIEATYSHIFRSGDLHLDHHTPALDSVLIGATLKLG